MEMAGTVSVMTPSVSSKPCEGPGVAVGAGATLPVRRLRLDSGAKPLRPEQVRKAQSALR